MSDVLNRSSVTLPPPHLHPGAAEPLEPWHLAGQTWDFSRPLVMGVLNATPDSFSDGGDHLAPDAAVARAKQMAAEGADILDLGGASSHPKAAPVDVAEELRRVLPVVERLVAELPLPLSIDTQVPEVARACLQRGAALINDVSGLADLAMARVAAEYDVPLVVMYNNLTVPKESPALSTVSDMLAFFSDRVADCEAAGGRRLILDPGYGFGKTVPESLTVLQNLPLLRRFNRPLLVCTSRKGSLGVLGQEPEPKRRIGATLASSLYAVSQGANLVRVHDVKDWVQAQRTWLALTGFPGEV